MSANIFSLRGPLFPTRALLIALALAGAQMIATRSHAASTILLDGNSQVQIDAGSVDGVHAWNVDGQSTLAQLSSFIRIGATGGEQPLSGISAPILFMPDAKTLNATYTSTDYSVQIIYNLLGGALGSGVSDLSVQVKLQNLSASAMDFHFFQYVNFDLLGPDNDSLLLGTDLSGRFNEAYQFDGTAAVLQSVTAPGANRAEAAFFDSLLLSLTDGNPTTLNNNAVVGPGDVTWAMQWQFTVDPGSSVILSQGYNLSVTPIPEPSAWALGLAGLMGLIFRWKFRR